MEPVVRVLDLGKRYYKPDPDRPRTLQEAVLRGFGGLRTRDSFWALRQVSFDVQAGQIVGVLGQNGAGKSTLLRLIGGVGRPDAGRIAVQGKIGALIDLGAGFHPELTGRENVMINGVISGLTRREVAGLLDEIVAFAELEEFIDSPLRTYSTGMQMRLAFSVAVHIQPDILLVDEVLAVGDMVFQQKCLERIRQIRKAGCAVLLISHDVALVGQFCDQAMWLERGQVAALGPAEHVAEAYRQRMVAETRQRTPSSARVGPEAGDAHLRLNENRFGSMEVEISAVHITNLESEPVRAIESGAGLKVVLDYQVDQPVEGPVFGVTILAEDGQVCCDASTATSGVALPALTGRGSVALTFERLDLVGGEYTIDVGVYKSDWSYAYDYHWRAYPLTIRATPEEKGVLRPPQSWALNGRMLEPGGKEQLGYSKG